jgi:membrane fusion protein (multidrug efflux system)
MKTFPEMKRSMPIGLVFAAVMVVAGCKPDAGPPPAPPLPQVEVITVSTESVPDEPELIGQAEASSIVEIRPQVTGIIKQRHFSEGRDVKKGDHLYEIDPTPFKAAEISAKAREAQAQARLIQAKQNLARVKPLLAEDAVSQKDVDDAIAEDLASRAALESARGDLVKAKFDLDNTVIVAPVDGLIERTRFYQGRLVTAQTDLLTVIHQVDPMYVIVSAPESFLLKRRRDTLSKQIDHPGLYSLTGTAIFVDKTVYPHEGHLDFTDIGLRTDTGSRQARVVFPNPDRILLPGQFLTVRFHGVSKPHAILVPQRAVQQGPKGAVVYVVGQDDKVEVRSVKATDWLGDRWLIEEGLHAGERVVVEGFQRAMPGAQVRVAMAASSTPAATGAIPPPLPTQAEDKKSEETK